MTDIGPQVKKSGMMRAAISYMSQLLSRTQLGYLAGQQFRGKRNLYEVLGYEVNPIYPTLLARYQRQDIAHRIVEAPVGATWRQTIDEPIQVFGGNSAFDAAWIDLISKVDVFSAFATADKMLALGQYSVLLLGFDDGLPPIAPVNNFGKRKLVYVQAYSEGTTSILSYERDPKSPRFGKPVSYQIVVVSPALSSVGSIQPMSLPTMALEVNYTRAVHLAEDTLDSPLYGTPRLVPILNLLDDCLKVAGGSAESFWLMANRGMQADIDKEMELDQADAENLEVELEEYQHQLRRFIRTRGVTIKELGSQSPQPRDTFHMILSLIAAETGIPQRVLMGSEIGSLASMQDRSNWSQRVEERRENFATPKIVKPFVDTLVTAGVLPTYTRLEVRYPDTFVQNPLEVAQTSSARATSVANLTKSIGQPMVTVEEAREIVGLPGTPETGTLPASSGQPLNVQPGNIQPSGNSRRQRQALRTIAS